VDYIDKDYLPEFLGGPCPTKICEGGLLPKSLYTVGSGPEREGGSLGEDSVYHSVSLGKGQVHEVMLLLLMMLRVREAFCPRRRPHSGPIELWPVRHQTPTSLHYNTILLML